MGKCRELTGLRFGLLIALKNEGVYKKHSWWSCICDCGASTTVKSSRLLQGLTKSCGCLEKLNLKMISQSKHNIVHGMSKTRPFKIWQGMNTRCNVPNDPAYVRYGGRGITISEDWKCFEDFWKDMEEGYKSNLSIERKDVNKGYSKENCRWATMKEQGRNRRNNTIIEYKGESKCLSEFAEEYNLETYRLSYRLKAGWGIEKALNTPVRKRKPVTKVS